MTTLAELRSGLRVLLNDNAAEGYLWSDTALHRHLNDAIRDYSRSFRYHRESQVVTVAGQREYDLPADCLGVTRVEIVKATQASPLQEGGEAGYEVYGGKLVLSPPPTEEGQSLIVRYLSSHAALASDPDLSTVPAADEDLLLACACARALQALSTEEAKRLRFEQRSGRSAESAAALYWQQYQRGIGKRGATVRAGRLMAR